MEIDQVGKFQDKGGYWEGNPDSMGGAILSIETENVSDKQVALAQGVCKGWAGKIEIALQYIESVREEYKLEAQTFNNPNAFINSDSEWSIYFDTESEAEAVVGVEFSGDAPFQLAIGD
ncbi:hypothetical protein [Celerinatantimonas sp. MCCC 1A17872]|uniref:hypothetical protein n=1 Tax=Celerinatantimonas sp. MCCC 1A17872 TaxID=3177514 RepID=UPI0038C9B0DA